MLFVVAALGLPVSGSPCRQAHAEAARPVVHVFLQLDTKSSVLEKTLREHLPDMTVTVFGRFRDFEDAATSGKPDVLVSITPVLERRGKKAALQGLRGGKDTETYVLASVGQPLSGSLSGKTIGVVDLLGREGTESFISGLLKVADAKVKRVTKIEDLLPLLEFSAADGIVLSSSMLAKLMERTRLVVKTRDLPGARVGLPAVAVLSPAMRDIVMRAFQKVDETTKNILGIDAWSIR